MTSRHENAILDHLSEAWGEFIELDDKHPDDLYEFRHAIHQLQTLIALRVARRADPETWGGPELARHRESLRRYDLCELIVANLDLEPASLDKMSLPMIEALAAPFQKFEGR